MSAANLGTRVILSIHAALVDEDAGHDTWAAVARAAGMEGPAARLVVLDAMPATQRLFRELVAPAASRGIRPTHVLRHRLRAWEGGIDGEPAGDALDLLVDHTPLPLSRESEIRQDGRPALLWGMGLEPADMAPKGAARVAAARGVADVSASLKTLEGLSIRPITDDSPRGEQIERGPWAWLLDEVLREHVDAETMHAAVWLRAVLGLAGEGSPLRAWACAARAFDLEEMAAAIAVGGAAARLKPMVPVSVSVGSPVHAPGVTTKPSATPTTHTPTANSPAKETRMEGAIGGATVMARAPRAATAPLAPSSSSPNPPWRDRAMSFVRAQREQWGDARPGTAEYDDRERREIVGLWRATCEETNGGVSQRAFALAMGVDRRSVERFLEAYNDEWLVVTTVCAWLAGAAAGSEGAVARSTAAHTTPSASEPTTTLMHAGGLGAERLSGSSGPTAGAGHSADHITLLALNIPVAALDQLDAGRSATLAGLMERLKLGGGSPR